MNRSCSGCKKDLPRVSYTASQLNLGQGHSRCIACIHGSDTLGEPGARSSARHNLAGGALLDKGELLHPFAEGTFRFVAKAKYTKGLLTGQPSVVKWFKPSSVFSEDFFALDVKAADKALEFVANFNELGVIPQTVRINMPQVWQFIKGPRKGEKGLVEPFILRYQKFNSNTGWSNNNDGWPEVMQALSHFSYHISGGCYVLCDLQGGVYARGVILSDPVILSPTREFGVTDLGPAGISSFFHQHVCNTFCRPHWIRPANTAQYFVPASGTSMLSLDGPSRAGGAPSTPFTGGLLGSPIKEEDEKRTRTRTTAALFSQ